MNRKMKIILAFMAALSMVNLFSEEAAAEKRIGILAFGEDDRFIESQKGFMEQLKKDGFGETAVKYTIENAKGNKARAAEVAQKFAAAKLDLVFTIGTTATIAAAKVIKDEPIVFSIVYDPIEAGIAKSWTSSGNNTTGSSTRFPMTKLLGSLKLIAPVKKLAVLYTPGERHTEILLKELKGLQDGFQIKIVPVILNKEEEVASILPEIIRTVDAISLFGGSVYYPVIPWIADMAAKGKVITITHIEEFVEKGVLMGICANPHRAGRLAGEKAVKVLRGAKPSSIPIETEKNLDFVLNLKTAKAGQFNVPPDFMKTVTKTVE